MINLARGSAVLLTALVVTGCAGTGGGDDPVGVEPQGTEPSDGISFVPATPDLVAKCRRTAKTVGYSVPCPMRVPADLAASSGRRGCQLDIIGAGGEEECAAAWRGWVVGSSETKDQHLVITASPRPLADYAKVVNGPAWYPDARVKTLSWVRIKGWRMRAVYAPQRTNAGSAFANHVVLIWTVGQHTYGVGFHNDQGVPETLRLGEKLARAIKLISP